MNYKYKISRDIYQDAWNWWDSCNSSSHGVNWRDRVKSEIADKIAGKTQKESYVYLIPFLKDVYTDKEENIKAAKKFFKNEFDQKFQEGCSKIVAIMKKPIYREHFKIYLTTIERGPYNKSNGSVWICIYWRDPMGCFLHELCHFQFIHYWREDPTSNVSKLSDDQFEFLKESLTVILDEDFVPLIEEPDYGYTIHKEFRKELTEQWHKNKNFNQLVNFGVERIHVYNVATGKKVGK